MRTIRCDARVPDVVRELATREAPRECCGLLVGTAAAITGAVPIANIAQEIGRFELDPAAHIKMRREARECGLEVVGVFHSHVATPAVPSRRDLAEAAYPEYLCGIVSLQNGRTDFRLFELRGDSFDEVEMAIDRSRSSPAAPSQ
ncbi:MAG TPA: M67 family metallopeptidase [Vicinamibacterales bacterium]|nr:M67 family metallopeptidase [Vicinamibacterales bacterium]